MSWSRLPFWLAIVNLFTVFAHAEQESPVDFANEIQPILINNCLFCHGADSIHSGFDLSTREGLLKGGISGKAVVPGDSDTSYLVQLIEHAKQPHMPFGLPKLSDYDIERIRAWIDAGAAYDQPLIEGAVHSDETVEKEPLWSLEPIRAPAVPDIESDWPRTPVDAFIITKLRENGLSPSPPADRPTLIRRLTFVLHGLPPTLHELEQFERDESPDAYERLVDRLLASPRFGERWARHWLDIAHYADTYGYERDLRRPHAWRYRDYIIQSFNEDKPYDRFIREQIAGDCIDPTDPQSVIATGFLVTGPWDQEAIDSSSKKIHRKFRADVLDDMVTTVMTATAGMTVNCARCHDHKFDPISQEEYYKLTAVFAGVQHGNRVISEYDEEAYERRVAPLLTNIKYVRAAIAKEEGQPLQLADLIGAGNGFGSGKRNQSIDPRTGRLTDDFDDELPESRPNEYRLVDLPYVDGVFIPDITDRGAPITSTGIKQIMETDTAGTTRDSIRAFFLEGFDGEFFRAGFKLDESFDRSYAITMNPNKGITFDLELIRLLHPDLFFTRFQGDVAFVTGGAIEWMVIVDGELKARQTIDDRPNGVVNIDVVLEPTSRFLTILTTDGGDGQNEDRIVWLNPVIHPRFKHPAEHRSQPIETYRRMLSGLEDRYASVPKVEYAYAAVPHTPEPIFFLRRGDTESPEQEMSPGTINFVKTLPAVFGNPSMSDCDRRMALADWLVHRDNPLTRRVMVNRIWHYVFGRGIVDTPSDFGRNGSTPTHPDLLDWLADEFMDNGWSIKKTIKLLVMSRVFRQGAAYNEDAMAIDAGNRLLWRMNTRRMEAEAIRDSILALSGTLNLKMGGPGYESFEYIDKFAPEFHFFTQNELSLWRRTIYRFAPRNAPDPFLTVLDCPNPNNHTPVRTHTNTALQPLALLNNEFVLLQSNYFAERLADTCGEDPDEQIQTAFRMTFARNPSVREVELARGFLSRNGLFHFCRMLFNANEFVYID